MNPSRHAQSAQSARTGPLFSNRKPILLEPADLPMLDRALQALALGLALSLILVLALNPLSRLWQAEIAHLLNFLSLDAQLVSQTIHIGHASLGKRLGITMLSPLPDAFSLSLQGVMSFGIFGMTWAVRSMPLRCGLRLLCVLHWMGIAMIALQGDAFPYSVLDHTQLLFSSSLTWLLLTPLFLAAGFFLVERSWLNRIAASLLIIGFEIVALPLKLLLHSLLVALLSRTVIPPLFLGGGPILDVMLLAALYAWVLTWPQLKLSK